MAKKKKVVEREDRFTPEYQNLNVMKPIDVTALGTSEDPCFGKHYDLTTDECQRCGDHEFCALKMGQTLNGQRNKIESKNDFLDILETEVKPPSKAKLKKLIKSCMALGLSSIKTRKKVMKKLPHADEPTVKQLIKDLK